MISKGAFLFLLVLYFILFGLKRTFLETLQKNGKLLSVTQEMATYFFVFLFVVLMVIGILFTENAETQFANVSAGFENARSQINDDKPHRYFDINLDWIKGNE